MPLLLNRLEQRAAYTSSAEMRIDGEDADIEFVVLRFTAQRNGRVVAKTANLFGCGGEKLRFFAAIIIDHQSSHLLLNLVDECVLIAEVIASQREEVEHDFLGLFSG